MKDVLIEPLEEQKRWRGRDVKYWGGTWKAVSSVLPKFEISEFRAEAGSPANPYMRSVVRLPKTLFEQRIPVGVVSNTYTLAQHEEVADQCFEGIRQAGVNPVDLRCEVGLTELGEWMNLRVYLPDDRDFVPVKDDHLKLRLECYNSVDGSCRVLVLLGWLRLVCLNGLVISETKTELNDLHDARLDLARIPGIVCEAIEKVANDQARMTQWLRTAVRIDDIASWANQYVAGAWGKKAACRVFNICKSGYDVEIVDLFASAEPSEKPVRRTNRVPGSPLAASNLFDVSQALSWVATVRNNPDERLDWQSGVPNLVSKFGQLVGVHQPT
jgi:hypothetical protein